MGRSGSVLVYPIIYDRFETNFNTFGEAVLENVYELRIFERINGEYVCSFSIPIDEKFEHVKEENYVKVNGQLFIIRVVEDERTSGDVLSAYVECEHVSTELITEWVNASLMDDSSQTILDSILSGTRFSGSAVSMPGTHQFTAENKSATWALNHLIALTNGELRRSNFTIDLLPRIGSDSGVQFRYRKNIRSIKRIVDTKNVITRLYAFGNDELSISPIDSPNIGMYPRPRVGSVTYDEDDQEQLQAKAETYLANHDTPLVSYDVKVIELKAAIGYDDSEGFALGDTVRVYDEGLRLALSARIVEYEEYPLEPERSRCTLANFLPDLADKLNKLESARQVVDQVTTESGRVNTFWLEGKINALQNQIRVSGAYATATVVEDGGMLFENIDENSPDYGALYVGPGLMAIANEKSGNNWNWRAFGTGRGFTADEMNTGILNASLVKIMSASGNTVIDGDNITQTRIDKKSRTIMSASGGIKIQQNIGTAEIPVWVDKLYGDTAGALTVEDLLTMRLKVNDGTGHTLIDADTRMIDFSKFTTIVGQFTAANIDATNLNVAAANVTGLLTAAQIDATNLHVNVANIDGALTVGTNVGLGTAQDAAGVTSIVGGTVTTSFVNALNVQADSVKTSWLYSGKVTTDQLEVGTAKISAAMIDKIHANQIDVTGGKIAASQIDVSSLYVGSGGIRLDSSASISWATQVTGKPFIPSSASDVGAVAANQTAVFNALTNNGALQGLFMSSGQLYVNANYINAGTISAARINTSGLASEKIYQNGTPSNYGVIGGTYGDLALYYANSEYFRIENAYDHVKLSWSGKSDFLRITDSSPYGMNVASPRGVWDFNSATVYGITAKFK